MKMKEIIIRMKNKINKRKIKMKLNRIKMEINKNKVKKRKEKKELKIRKKKISFYMGSKMIRWMNIMDWEIKIYLDSFVQILKKNIFKKWAWLPRRDTSLTNQKNIFEKKNFIKKFFKKIKLKKNPKKKVLWKRKIIIHTKKTKVQWNLLKRKARRLFKTKANKKINRNPK